MMMRLVVSGPLACFGCFHHVPISESDGRKLVVHFPDRAGFGIDDREVLLPDIVHDAVHRTHRELIEVKE